MIKNFFSVLIFLFISLFISFIFLTYFSEENKKEININRKNVYSKITNTLPSLPLLKNNTNDVIIFNSGFDNNNKIKRNFWNLFKKND